MKIKNIIGYVIGIAMCCLVFFFILEFTKKDSKEYSYDGFSITLEGEFTKSTQDGIDIFYESLNSFVAVIKEDFKTLEAININENSSLEEYARAVLYNNDLNVQLNELENGKYIYFEYDGSIDNDKFYYMGVVTKGSNEFWLVNFCSKYENKDDFKLKFLKWAKTIKVK